LKQVFFGARVFDGTGFQDDIAVVTDGAKIKALVPVSERPRDAVQHDLSGGILSPGLIDAQINGGGGAFFNTDPSVNGIATILKAHRAFGTTHALPTVITDSASLLHDALQAGKTAQGLVPGFLGLHVEGPFIDVDRKGVHPANHIRVMTDADCDMLIANKTAVMMVTLAPNTVSPALIKRLADAGIIVSLGHAEASDLDTLSAIDAGASAITHLYNAMSQLQGRAPGLVGAALADPRVIAGLIADGHHVAPIAIFAALSAKGADGIALVSDAMPPSAGGPKEFNLMGRRASVYGSRLSLDDGTLAGAAITLADAVRYLIHDLRLDPALALRMATLTPARMLKIDMNYGRIQPVYSASFTIFDDKFGVRGTVIDGLA